MKRNQLIGILLIFGVLLGYMIISSPSKEEQEKQKHKRDSIAKVEAQKDSLKNITKLDSLKSDSLKKDSLKSNANIASTKTDSISNDSSAFARFGLFYKAMQGTDTFEIVENELVRFEIASKGGFIRQIKLKNFKTWNQKDLKLINEKSHAFGLSFISANRTINTSGLYFIPQKSGDKSKLVMKLPAIDNSGKEIGALLFKYSIDKESYMLNFSLEFVNAPALNISSNFLEFRWINDIVPQEKNMSNEQQVSSIYYSDSEGDVDHLSERSNEEKNVTTSMKWISFKQQFFSYTFIANDKFKSAKLKTTVPKEIKDSSSLKQLEADFNVEFNPASQKNISFSIYTGPLKYKTLRSYNLGLERQIPIGWSFAPLAWINQIAVIPIFNWLETYGLNYGIIILILTIILKIVLFPIAWKTYSSSAKMRILKPEVDEIAAKFPKKEDAMKKQQLTMELYKKAGANPMSGCLPMLLQLPILIAMFRFFPAAIELRQQAFLWANDLSSYDSILNLGFNIPFYGNHVSLFTLLMTISTIIYTKINNDMMGSTNQMPGMKTVMYIMPIMFLGFFNSYSSGLSYYYLLANLITFAQMFAIRRILNEDKLRLKIAENKKKPVKKSKFQQRLEEAAKQRGIQPKR